MSFNSSMLISGFFGTGAVLGATDSSWISDLMTVMCGVVSVPVRVW